MSKAARIVASRRWQQRCAIAIVGLALLTVASTHAAAAPITFTFNGTVTFAQPFLPAFSIGDSLTGSLTYDSALLDSDASSTRGLYSPLSALTFDIDGYVGSFASGPSTIEVLNDSPGGDRLNFTQAVSGASFGSLRPFRLLLVLRDPTGLALSSDGLPSAFDVSQFAVSEFLVSFTNRADPYDTSSPGTNFTGVQGILTSGSVAAIPEPATLILLGASLASFTLRRRRKRRSAS